MAPRIAACYVSGMPDRSRKLPTDPNQRARAIVDLATADREPAPQPAPSAPEPEKNPAAVAPGKLGGSKGGPARAKALSKKRRAEIAKAAAKDRWGKK